MWIEVSTIWARVVRATPAEHAWLDDFLTYQDPRVHFVKALRGTDGTTRLYNHGQFPAGMVPLVQKRGRDEGQAVQIVKRPVIPPMDPNADLAWLRDYQRAALPAVQKRGRGLLWLPTGAGKCLAPDVRVVRYDGRLVFASEVQQGDQLMGPDGMPRTVLSTTTGFGPMRRVIPNKGQAFDCNHVHVLTLQHTTDHSWIDVPLNEWEQWPRSRKHLWKLVRAEEVSFPQAPGDRRVDPYFDTLPLRIPRKQAPPRKRNTSMRTGFRVEPLPDGDYVGWALDGDGRFLLEDWIITHNTEIAVGITRAWPQINWLFVVHRSGLMHQAADRYILRRNEHRHSPSLMPDPGRIGDGQWTTAQPLTVATFQTLARRRGTPEYQALAQQITGIMVDESHTLPAASFYKTLQSFHNAPMRLGMSGTPLARGDKRSLLAVAALGPTIYRIKPDVLVNAGVLAKPTIHMLPVVQDIHRSTWQGVYGAGVVKSATRNRAVVSACVQAHKPALVFVKQLNHGQELLARLQRKGLNAEFVWGKKDQAARKRAIKRLVHGDTDVLICSVIFQEGTDIPALRSVVIASGGKSVIAAIQRVGRGMRRAAGKSTFQVWDFDDRGTASLQRHARARRKAYIREGYDVVVEEHQLHAAGAPQ